MNTSKYHHLYDCLLGIFPTAAAAGAVLLSASVCEGAAAADAIFSLVEAIWLHHLGEVTGVVLGLGGEKAQGGLEDEECKRGKKRSVR